MKFASLLLSIILVIFTQIGCQDRQDPVTREKELESGFSMMDRGEYTEAIHYFESMLLRDPHFHVKLAVASAYAGRAGVKLQQIYAFSVVKEVPTPEIELKGLTLDKQSLSAIESLAKFSAHWNKIPDIKIEERGDLMAALKVLEQEPQPGVRLYAAALRVVVLKSSIAQGIENFKLKTEKQICSSDVKPYVSWTGKVFEGVLELVSDLEGAFPEQKENYEKIRAQINASSKQLKTLSWPASEKCYALQ